MDPAIEDGVTARATEQPAYGQLRVSNELKKRGVFVSPGGVRSIWQRHNLETFQKRPQALETKASAENLVFSKNQFQALEKVRVEKEADG